MTRWFEMPNVRREREAEERAQQNMQVRAQRLRAFKAKTEGYVWWHDPSRHIDVLVRPIPNRPKTAGMPYDPFSPKAVA